MPPFAIFAAAADDDDDRHAERELRWRFALFAMSC